MLTKFFRKLGDYGDLGFNDEFYDDGELKKQLLKMAIKSDNGYIYFNELLYRCMRRKYGNMKISRKMQIFELKTQYRIFLMTLEMQNKNKNVTKEQITNCIVKKENGVNPFLLVMNFKISFKTWLKHARDHLRKSKKEMSEESATIYDDDPKLFEVEIEVEEYHEETSDEETNDGSNLGSLIKKAKSQLLVREMGQYSNHGSVMSSHQASARKSKRNTDPV
jgi:hypothetical protein